VEEIEAGKTVSQTWCVLYWNHKSPTNSEHIITVQCLIRSVCRILCWHRALGFDSRLGAGNVSLRHRVQTGSEDHPADYTVGTEALSLWVKRPGSETDHSRLSSAEVKNAWIYTTTLPICLRGVVLSWVEGQLYLNLYHLLYFETFYIHDLHFHSNSRCSTSFPPSVRARTFTQQIGNLSCDKTFAPSLCLIFHIRFIFNSRSVLTKSIHFHFIIHNRTVTH